MSVVDLFARLLGALGRLLGSGRNDAAATRPCAPAPNDAAPAQPVAAVAVRAWRRRHDPFMLACRLASVARLNTPAGRKPHGTGNRFEGLPPIPSVRLGAKRLRRDANQGPRVLVRSRTAASSARIIPFPAGSVRRADRTAPARRAA